MAETGKNWIYCPPIVLTNMIITLTPSYLIAFELIYGSNFYILKRGEISIIHS